MQDCMRFISWNVNGIRACQRGGFLDWFTKQDADIVCIQETKAHVDQLEAELAEPLTEPVSPASNLGMGTRAA